MCCGFWVWVPGAGADAAATCWRRPASQLTRLPKSQSVSQSLDALAIVRLIALRMRSLALRAHSSFIRHFFHAGVGVPECVLVGW